jgi:hypothetical protein
MNYAVRIVPGPSLQYHSVHNPNHASSCPNCGRHLCHCFVDHQRCVPTAPPASRSPHAAHAATARVHRLAPYSRAAVVRRRSQFLSSPSQQPLTSCHCAMSLTVRLCSKHRALPQGATSLCASVSSMTGVLFGASRPPLRANWMPHEAARFLNGMGLATVSRLWPRNEAISSSPSSRDSPSSSPTDPLTVLGR